ncbi:MAG: hypothetical protein HEQ15_03755 [Betaproteobacteria bacterium]
MASSLACSRFTQCQLPEIGSLGSKVIKAADWLLKNGASKADVKAAKVAVSNPHSLFSIDTLHAYIHNKEFNPVADELKIAWDNLGPFIAALYKDG